MASKKEPGVKKKITSYVIISNVMVTGIGANFLNMLVWSNDMFGTGSRGLLDQLKLSDRPPHSSPPTGQDTDCCRWLLAPSAAATGTLPASYTDTRQHYRARHRDTLSLSYITDLCPAALPSDELAAGCTIALVRSLPAGCVPPGQGGEARWRQVRSRISSVEKLVSD